MAWSNSFSFQRIKSGPFGVFFKSRVRRFLYGDLFDVVAPMKQPASFLDHGSKPCWLIVGPDIVKLIVPDLLRIIDVGHEAIHDWDTFEVKG